MPPAAATAVLDPARDPGRAFCELALRLGRHLPGLVDSYVGDPALAARVAAEQPTAAGELADHATTLVAAAGALRLAPGRRASLLARTAALAATARRLAGEHTGFVDEVEACFQVRPAAGPVDGYAAAHQRLGEVLPGTGPVAARLEAWRVATVCPPGQVAAAVRALSDALQDQVLSRWRLPLEEQVEWQLVGAAAWAGSAEHLGRARSRVRLSVDLPVRLAQLPGLVAHEAYPGHHTASCRQQQALVHDRGWLEHAVSVATTPDRLVAEGAAELGLSVAVGPAWGRWAQEVYARVGVGFDGALAEDVASALGPLAAVRQDAALLLHAEDRGEAAAVGHLVRWGLFSDRRARHALGFLRHPLWRSYISTYVEGARLVGAWLQQRPAGTDETSRYARLLDEPLLPADLATDVAAGR